MVCYDTPHICTSIRPGRRGVLKVGECIHQTRQSQNGASGSGGGGGLHRQYVLHGEKRLCPRRGRENETDTTIAIIRRLISAQDTILTAIERPFFRLAHSQSYMDKNATIPNAPPHQRDHTAILPNSHNRLYHVSGGQSSSGQNWREATTFLILVK